METEGAAVAADSKMLLTACDDMHSHLYDVEHASLVDAFSGKVAALRHAMHARIVVSDCPCAAFYLVTLSIFVGSALINATKQLSSAEILMFGLVQQVMSHGS